MYNGSVGDVRCLYVETLFLLPTLSLKGSNDKREDGQAVLVSVHLCWWRRIRRAFMPSWVTVVVALVEGVVRDDV